LAWKHIQETGNSYWVAFSDSHKFFQLTPIGSNYAFLSVEEDDESHLNLYKVDYSNSGNVFWAKGIQCPAGSGWLGKITESCLSKDGSRIYLLAYFDQYSLFYTLSSSTGKVVSTSYKLFDAIADVTDEGIIEVNGRVYFHIEYSRSAFFIYNTTTDKFDYSYVTDSSSFIFTDMTMLNKNFMLSLLRAIDYSTTYISKNIYSAFFEWNSCNNSTISMTSFDSGDFLIIDRVSTAPNPTLSNFILGGFYTAYSYATYTPSSTTPLNEF
jgi:hypothetical protein